jgi:type IV pilus assembly protein PilB
MPVTDEMRRLILEGAGADVMRVQARAEGMSTLREDGLEKIKAGDTSVPEVLRVAGSSAS